MPEDEGGDIFRIDVTVPEIGREAAGTRLMLDSLTLSQRS